MTRPIVTKGSGNVFRDLGFSEEKSAELIFKSSRLQALQETIKSRGWKQVETAAQLGIDQAKVSKLLAGQMAGFSIERLIHYLSLLGQDVEVTVRKAPKGRRRGTVRARLSKTVTIYPVTMRLNETEGACCSNGKHLIDQSPTSTRCVSKKS